MTIQTMRDFGIGEGQIYVGGHWVDSASRERREIAIRRTKASSPQCRPPPSKTRIARSPRPAKLSLNGAAERRWSAAPCFRDLQI
jgi:hypothetical protein